MDRSPETFSNSLGAPLLGSKAVDLDAGRKEERMGADSTYRIPPLARNPRSPHTAALDPSPSLRLSWKKGQKPRALESEISVKEEALSTAQDRASRPAGSHCGTAQMHRGSFKEPSVTVQEEDHNLPCSTLYLLKAQLMVSTCRTSPIGNSEPGACAWDRSSQGTSSPWKTAEEKSRERK